MGKSIFKLRGLAVMACLAAAMYSFTISAAAQSWTGTWQLSSSWGEMTLTQDGNKVSGTYSYSSGKSGIISGTVSGNIFSGEWIEPFYDAKGDFQFTMMSNGMSFGVKWRYIRESDWRRDDDGKRINPKKVPDAPANSSEKGVVINGVRWATRNVDAPGTFTTRPEEAGMMYQWNRKKAWSAIGDVTGWDKTDTNKNDVGWAKANDPSPVGWRVPTHEEFQTLRDTVKVSNVVTTQNGVVGRKFTDKATGNSMFLPAAGFRHGEDGSLYYTVKTKKAGGFYWGSTVYDSRFSGHSLNFYGNDNILSGGTESGFRFGNTIRPVVE